MKVQGIHHISGIVRHPQENIDFYTSLLGLRLIKKAVNFDDANTYHFYFGNRTGDSGTVITYFPWNNRAEEGRVGDGQVGIVSYAIPRGSISFWENRLKDFKVPFERLQRFNETYLFFKDKDGILSELVESDQGITNTHEYNGVTSDVAIKGFSGAVLYSKDFTKTKDFFISVLGMNLLDENNDYYRLKMDGQLVGQTVDIFKGRIGRGRNSTGTNHHIALTVEDDELEIFKNKIESMGVKVSDIKNRDFFRALYFREPGGIMIELSSSKPGFGFSNIDDQAKELYIPEHLESRRAEIEASLTPVFVKETKVLNDYSYNTKEEYEDYLKHQALLKEINDFAKLAKTRELTKEETEKRKILRKQYIDQIKNVVSQMTDNIYIENEDGTTKKLERKGDK